MDQIFYYFSSRRKKAPETQKRPGEKIRKEKMRREREREENE